MVKIGDDKHAGATTPPNERFLPAAFPKDGTPVLATGASPQVGVRNREGASRYPPGTETAEEAFRAVGASVRVTWRDQVDRFCAWCERRRAKRTSVAVRHRSPVAGRRGRSSPSSLRRRRFRRRRRPPSSWVVVGRRSSVVGLKVPFQLFKSLFVRTLRSFRGRVRGQAVGPSEHGVVGAIFCWRGTQPHNFIRNLQCPVVDRGYMLLL